MQNRMHVKKGDKVVVIAGKDRGKQGKVIESMPSSERVVVEGVNKVKRHQKPTQKMPQGGIMVKEAPVHVSNVMLVCPACDKATRSKKVAMAAGGFARACKECGEMIDKDR